MEVIASAAVRHLAGGHGKPVLLSTHQARHFVGIVGDVVSTLIRASVLPALTAEPSGRTPQTVYSTATGCSSHISVTEPVPAVAVKMGAVSIGKAWSSGCVWPEAVH